MQRLSDDSIPQTVSQVEFQAVVRLLGSLTGEGLPHIERVKRLMEGVTRLLDGDIWVWWHGRFSPAEQTTTYQILDGGYADEQQRARFREWMVQPEVHILFAQGVTQNLSQAITVSRADVSLSAGRPEGRNQMLARERSGMGDFLVSFIPFSDGTCTAPGIHRALEKGTFTERDKWLLHTLVAELEDMHGPARQSPKKAVVDGLSPRLKQVLGLVLEGHSRKQIARDLTLSEHTVGGYLKDLHTRLNVRSRGELMAHFMPE